MTNKPLYEDGVHKVIHASAKDRHPMRYIVKSMPKASVNKKRYFACSLEAIKYAKKLTKMTCAYNSIDAQLAKAFIENEAAQTAAIQQREIEKQQNKIAREKLQAANAVKNFSLVGFICVRANPAASIWRRMSYSKVMSKNSPASAFYKDDLAVFHGDRVVCDRQNKPIIYRSISAAEDMMAKLYHESNSDIPWIDGRSVTVDKTHFISSILYDPTSYKEKSPFIIYLRHPLGKPLFEENKPSQRNHGIRNVAGQKLLDGATTKDEREAIQAAQRLKDLSKGAYMNTNLTMHPKKFKTPWGAKKAALKHEWNSIVQYQTPDIQEHYNRGGTLVLDDNFTVSCVY